MKDLISRQDAIDALEKVAELFPWKVPGNRDTYDRYNEAWNDAIGRAEIEIEELPSAQPEQIARDIATIIENEKDMRVILQNAEHTETHSCDCERTETHDWIPVTERQPEESDYIGCSECIDGAVWYYTDKGAMGLGHYYKSTKSWATTDDTAPYGNVVAWRKLPEPYKEGQE